MKATASANRPCSTARPAAGRPQLCWTDYPSRASRPPSPAWCRRPRQPHTATARPLIEGEELHLRGVAGLRYALECAAEAAVSTSRVGAGCPARGQRMASRSPLVTFQAARTRCRKPCSGRLRGVRTHGADADERVVVVVVSAAMVWSNYRRKVPLGVPASQVPVSRRGSRSRCLGFSAERPPGPTS
jgi:hypothetical protein